MKKNKVEELDYKLFSRKYKELLALIIAMFALLISIVSLNFIVINNRINDLVDSYGNGNINDTNYIDSEEIADEVVRKQSFVDIKSSITDKVTKYEYDQNDNEYILNGYITNNSNKDYYEVEFIYEIYNKDGKLIDELSDTIDSLKAKSKANFSLDSSANYSGDINSFKLVSIRGLDKQID